MDAQKTDGPALLDRFIQVLEKDRKSYNFPDWMASWSYQEFLTERRGHADMDTGAFLGPANIKQWLDFTASGMSAYDYLSPERMAPVVQKSLNFDKAFLNAHGLEHDDQCLLKVAAYNAEDYIFQNFYPVPERQKIKRILDFGGGYGRQINLWSGDENLEDFVMVDAIPNSYCMQSVYCRSSGLDVNEYLDAPDTMTIRPSSEPTVHHLPTWRLDLLPDEYFDAITCIQVLTELNSSLCLYVLQQFHRVLRPGGMLYIRDHDSRFAPNKISLPAVLPNFGFVLEFRPHGVDQKEIHGIPKIWRKLYPPAITTM